MGGWIKKKIQKIENEGPRGTAEEKAQRLQTGLLCPTEAVDLSKTKWDDRGSVLENYWSFGVVSNPNLLGVRARTSRVIESDSIQLPPPKTDGPISEFEPIDSGSELEEDDVKSALGKKRRDEKTAPLQALTAMQRLHIGALVEKCGDDYQSMFMDTKLNKLQHSVLTLEKLCNRYHMYKDKNPMLVPLRFSSDPAGYYLRC